MKIWRRYGMKSLILCDGAEPERVSPLCEKYNAGVEIQNFDPNVNYNKNELTGLYKSVFPQNREKYMHAPFWDLCPGSRSVKIAEATRYYFDYAYEIAEELGCSGVIVHHGYVPHTSLPDGWKKRSVIFWNDFFSAHTGGINIFMENHLDRTADIIGDVVDMCQNCRLAVNLDIGHAHCISDMTVADWIKQLNKRIRYVHLHQNYGVSDEHLGLKKGDIPIKEVLDGLNEYAPDAVWALECNLDDMEDSILFLKENGYIK